MIQNQPSEFISVIKLVNCYIATHFREDRRIFISERPEKDLKVALATAKLFAEKRNLPFERYLYEPKEPIITVAKYRNYWYPAELYAAGAYILTEDDRMSLKGDLQVTISKARSIADSRGLDYKPSIGISIYQK